MRSLFIVLILLLTACAGTPKRNEPEPAETPVPTPQTQVKCIDCGVVRDIRVVKTGGQNDTAKKPVLSGIVGGVVSKPSSGKPATRYEILIQMLNGKKVLVTQTVLSAGLRLGSKVRVSQGRILAVGP